MEAGTNTIKYGKDFSYVWKQCKYSREYSWLLTGSQIQYQEYTNVVSN